MTLFPADSRVPRDPVRLFFFFFLLGKVRLGSATHTALVPVQALASGTQNGLLREVTQVRRLTMSDGRCRQRRADPARDRRSHPAVAAASPRLPRRSACRRVLVVCLSRVFCVMLCVCVCVRVCVCAFLHVCAFLVLWCLFAFLDVCCLCTFVDVC